MNTIAERLKAAREKAGLTQPELAAKARVSQGTIGNIESGLRKRPRELLSIAHALKVNPVWLESGKGSMSLDPFEDYLLRSLASEGIEAVPLKRDATTKNSLPKWLLHACGDDQLFIPDFAATRPDSSMVYVTVCSRHNQAHAQLKAVEEKHPHDFVLLDGDGQVHMGARVATAIARGRTTNRVNTEPGPDLRGKVPLISWVRAGEWCEAADPFQPGDAERWMDCPVNHSSSTFALRVRGDSMTAPHGNSRTYPEGCLIFVDPERKTPVNGDRIVACLEGSHEVTFKVYKNEDGRQWLQPLNPSHEPIREPFKVLGTVLGKWEDG